MKQATPKQPSTAPAQAAARAPRAASAGRVRLPPVYADDAAPPRAHDTAPTSGFDFGRVRILGPGGHGGVPAWIQPKLAVGPAGDAFEQEADRIADQVMRMPAPPPPAPAAPAAPDAPPGGGGVVQRMCVACEEEGAQVRRQTAPEGARDPDEEPAEPPRAAAVEEPAEAEASGPAETERASTADLLEQLVLDDEPIIVHRACAACTEEDEAAPVQRDPDGAAPVPEDAGPSVGRVLGASAGQPLPAAVRDFMEPRFGVDFSPVAVHTGPEAAASARELSAHAYTVGRHIVFGEGRYEPATQAGQRLLAHELTHVVQQSRSGGVARRQEMIPGFHAQHAARPQLKAAERAVQREKIEHRALAWDDFQGKAPKTSPYWASTASGFNAPDLKALIPKDLEATDTGEECVIAKKKSGDVMGTTYSVDIGLDSAQIDVTAYMSQEKSWRMPWTTDPAAREKKCKAEMVKACEKSFVKPLKQIEKDCKKLEKDCKKAFKGNIANWSVEIEGEQIEATSAAECTSVVLERCRALMPQGLSFDYTMAGTTITARSKDECSDTFKEACVGELLDAASGALLQHEQGHFDVTHVRAGQTRDALRALADGFDREVTLCAKGDTEKAQKAGKAKAVKAAKAKLAKELKALEKEYNKGVKQLSATQKQYDKETKHGVVEDVQQAWQERLAEGELP